MKKEPRWWPRHPKLPSVEDRREAPLKPIVDGRRAHDYVSRRMFMIGGLVVAVTMTVTLVAVVLVALSVNDLQSKQISTNQASIRRLDRVTGELRALTDPTPAQYRQQIAAGLKRCAREPSCRGAIKSLTK